MKIDPDTKALVSFLRGALIEQEYRYHRADVMNALGQLGPAAAAAVPELVSLLKDKKLNAPELLQLTSALARIGPAAKDAAPFLAQLLKEDRPDALRGGLRLGEHRS